MLLNPGLWEILTVLAAEPKLAWVLAEGVFFTRTHHSGDPNSLFENHHSESYHMVSLHCGIDLKQYERATRFLLTLVNNKFNAASEYKMDRFCPWKNTKYKTHLLLLIK